MGPIWDEWEEFAFDRIKRARRAPVVRPQVQLEGGDGGQHGSLPCAASSTPIRSARRLADHKRNVNTMYHNGHARMIAPAPQHTNREHVRAIDSPPEWKQIETVGELGRTTTQS
jgi:hypothetical protein